ncbi:MAG: hypothetical protein HYX67_10540 [Candidatus Melainabacteria bacterium]|nr:hypothetical protein [Candidatus Melainabacteria bacterium]
MDFSIANQDRDASVERREMVYAFRAGENYTLLDVTTYDQIELTLAQVGSAAAFMKEGMEKIVVTFFMHQVVGFELPRKVQLEVSWIGEGQAPGQFDRVLATLETGAVIAVPTHIKQGQVIWVDTVERIYLDSSEPS